MLHACNAVDGTAKKSFPASGVRNRFVSLLRANYSVLGPMGMPGVNLEDSLFPIGATDKRGDRLLDLADVLYEFHRCIHAHGDDPPIGFEMLPDDSGPVHVARIDAESGRLRFSYRVLFGLLAVAVLAPVNKDQVVSDDYFLSYGDQVLWIKDWWGRVADFPTVLAAQRFPRVTLDFSGWPAAQETSRAV